MKTKREGVKPKYRHLVQSIALLRHHQLSGKEDLSSREAVPIEVTTTDIVLTDDLLKAVIDLKINRKPGMMSLTGVDDPKKDQSSSTTESLGEI